jgi:hypothetical protein
LKKQHADDRHDTKSKKTGKGTEMEGLNFKKSAIKPIKGNQ